MLSCKENRRTNHVEFIFGLFVRACSLFNYLEAISSEIIAETRHTVSEHNSRTVIDVQSVSDST